MKVQVNFSSSNRFVDDVSITIEPDSSDIKDDLIDKAINQILKNKKHYSSEPTSIKLVKETNRVSRLDMLLQIEDTLNCVFGGGIETSLEYTKELIEQELRLYK